MNKENKLKDSIEPVNIDGTKKILDQLMNSICKINIKGKLGTGFFCKIPFRKETIKILLTNYNILNKEDFKEKKKLNLSLYDEKESITIDLDVERETYFNKKCNITIIELKDKDNIKNYLELDNNLFQDNIEINYINKSIYILHYPDGKNVNVSYGLINNIDKYNINHNCSIDICSSGSPILNLKSKKVIGIHNKVYNIGTLLKNPLKDFVNKLKKKLININNAEYKIIKELGKGNFGNVYQVLNLSDNKYYAIKIIPIKNETKEKIKKFEKEAEILSKFNCDNIVKYYDSSKDNNNIYILMEFCGGSNLRNFIDKNKNNNILIDEDILKNIIKQICIGIKAIHDKKIVHRDLKPENIFINEDKIIKIGDFGISKQLEIYNIKISINKEGTYDYIAPEILYKGIYNNKSDIWSLGCIIYELFNLSVYNQDKTFNEIKQINSNIYNDKWQVLIDSLLQPDYNKRFDINQINQFLENKLNKKNIIIGEIYIKNNDWGKYIQIINSFETRKKEYAWPKSKDDWKFKNEKEIKENIEIKINGKLIEFTYKYKFNKATKYIIEYSFKNNLTKTCFMFSGCESLTNLDLSNFNTKNITNMSDMFYDCNSLTNIDLSKFNTKNVTNMSGMFYNCNSLTNIDLSKFNTENVTSMSSMFYRCKSLKSLDLSNFNTQNVTYMSSMFEGCESLRNLYLLNFNTKNVTYMSCMFEDCKSMGNLNLSNFDTKNVTNMRRMFIGCNLLTNLNLSNFNTQNVTNMSQMFEGCKSLRKLNLSNFNTKNVVNMGNMFSVCKLLKHLDLSNFNTQNVTNMNGMFNGCNLLIDLDLSNFNTKNVNDMWGMFYYCKSLTYLNLSNFNTQNVTDMRCMFEYCESLKKENIITKDNKILNLFK